MRDINELMSIYKTICKSLKESDKENSELNNYDNFKEVFSKEEFEQIVNCKKNRTNKRRRTSNKIRELVHYLWNIKPSNNQEFNLIFGTATLNEKYIKLQERTKAKLIDAWIKRHFIDSGLATVIHTTYKDNKFLTDEDKKVLEGFKHTDQYYYQVYCLGQWRSIR